MPIPGFLSKTVADLRGSWTAIDETEMSPQRAFVSRNVRFSPNFVKSRDGFVADLAVSGAVTSMHQWITSGFSALLFYEGTKAKVKNLANSDAAVELFTLAGRGMVVAEAGTMAYIAVYGNDGLGAGQCRIAQPFSVGAPCDKAFPAPWTNVPVITEPSSGEVTAGDHKLAYIVTTRHGGTIPPSPYTAGVFAPVTKTAAGGKNLQLSIGPLDIPAEAVALQVIMTRADNPDRWYFVPDGMASAPGGASGWTINATIDISDDRLAANATPADDYFSILSQTAGGTGPFNPSAVAVCGNRMAYFVDSKVYISEPWDYQYVTEDQHAVQAPGQRRIVTGRMLRGTFYLFGPAWTYALTPDNEVVPRMWATPQEVSGALGAPAHYCVEDRTAGDYFWVANEAGLFLFNGQYSDRPISYYNSDVWKRINWSSPGKIVVRDDYVNRQVHVLVPLDSASEPNADLVWDYTRGLTPDAVDFSLDDTPGNCSSIEILRDATLGKSALVFGPQAAGNLLKQVANRHNDNGAAIHSVYESGLIFEPGEGPAIALFGGAQYDVHGAGTLLTTAYALDRNRSVSAAPLALVTAPGVHPYRRWNLRGENQSVRFETNAVDHWFSLSKFEASFKHSEATR